MASIRSARPSRTLVVLAGLCGAVGVTLSSLLASMLAVGLLLNVSVRRNFQSAAH